MKISKSYKNLCSASLVVIAFTILIFIYSCHKNTHAVIDDPLYEGFQNPPAEARPFVRWWWNGNKVNKKEIERELELLKDVGFGGVEINPIAMPDHAPNNGDSSQVWMSDEWIDMVVAACQKAKSLDLAVDLIVGTGWPFGGEFLEEKDISQRVVPHFLPYSEELAKNLNEQYLITKYLESPGNKNLPDKVTHQLHFARLVPLHCSNPEESIDLLPWMDKSGQLNFQMDDSREYLLHYGILERNFKEVYFGAPGGAGPIMDHYKKEVTLAYLSRLNKIAKKSGIPLSQLIRALFCDSIELSGANWTDHLGTLFFETYGYRLEPWFPFVFYDAKDGYLSQIHFDHYTPSFKEEIKKVRFDYNQLLVNTFLENFTRVFQEFCTTKNLKCRYQAYGTPFLMGMLDGYMIPDIPESNNWIYSAEMKDSVWQWNQYHGYMIWNMYAAAGGHLTGRRIVSGETMTNTKGVFRTTLEEIKQHDDMNFITGINHSILHGFNYSPPDLPFPGWLRYGAFFSEWNPWWKHLHHWVDYNSRLSFVFQNSQPQKSIAIIGPTSDLWGDEGLIRLSFHSKPRYLYKLWEPISQLGYSCEYLNQKVLNEASIEGGRIAYGPMQYDLLILGSLQSIHPETALSLKQYVESGGKVVVIDSLPSKSLHFQNSSENDSIVLTTLQEITDQFPSSFIFLPPPRSLDVLFSWTREMLEESELEPDVFISNPQQHVYQIHQKTPDKSIFFFTNVHRSKKEVLDIRTNIKDHYPWIWNPETGERKPFPYAEDPRQLQITLDPLESILLVYENEKPADHSTPTISIPGGKKLLQGEWQVTGNHVNGNKYHWNLAELGDISKSSDPTLQTFAGELIYKATFENDRGYTQLDLGNVNEGVTQVFINGEKVGTRWYGKATYELKDMLREGPNELEIHYTTVLANYCKSLKDNKVVQNWTKHNATAPTGIEGPIELGFYQ